MDQKTIIGICIFFLLLVTGMFMFTYLKNTEIQQLEETTPEPISTPEVSYPDITRVDAKHYFINGVHTLVGEIPMPTPCDLLEAELTRDSQEQNTALLYFNVINNADTCIEVITPQRFQVVVEAPEDINFIARFLDRSVELNLVPAAPGETPEEFELFIKG